MTGLFSIRRFGRYGTTLMFMVLMSAAGTRTGLAQAVGAEDIPGSTLTLQSVLHAVKHRDYRIKQLQEESLALQAESQAASDLPDPTVFAAIQNLPSDSFKHDQEAMTQLRVGIRQMFPKGEMLDIKSDLAAMASDLPLIRSQGYWLDRKKQAEQAWLEAWYWQKTMKLLHEDQLFLQQVKAFIQSLYEVGAKDQSELIGADLELIKLNEKQIEAQKNYQQYRLKLNTLAHQRLEGGRLSDPLPDLSQLDYMRFDIAEADTYLLNHPRIQGLNQQIEIAERKVDLVKQEFEPSWGLEVSYALRDGENMDGSDRSDFLSAGVSVQLPLFSDNKQRHNQTAVSQRLNAALMTSEEALSEMRFELESLLLQYRYIDQQRVLYQTDILPTLETQRKSALQSYESDQGDLRLVMNLFLKEQAARTMHQRLRVNQQKLISSLNFLLGIESPESEYGAQESL